MQATKAAQPSASKSACKDELLVLIQKEAERQLQNMEPLLNEASVERFKFYKLGKRKMVQDTEHLVAIANEAVDSAQKQEEQVKQEYQTLSEIHAIRLADEENIPALTQELTTLEAQIADLSDEQKLKGKRGQIEVVLNKLRKILKLESVDEMLRKVGEAEQEAEQKPELYGTYTSAFAGIPKTSPHAAFLTIATNIGVSEAVQSCIPCTAQALVADFLRQHGTNPRVKTALQSSFAIRVISKGNTVEKVGKSESNETIHLIFVKDVNNITSTDIKKADFQKAGNSENSKQGAKTNQCNTTHLQSIREECDLQIKRLEHAQDLFKSKLIAANLTKLYKARELKTKKIDKLVNTNNEWQKTKKEEEKKTLNRLEKRMDDMNIRTTRFEEQQNEAINKLALYTNHDAKKLMNNKFEAFDAVFRILQQIVKSAEQERKGDVKEGSTVEFIKKETEIDDDDTHYLQYLRYVFALIPTEQVKTVNVNVRVWTPTSIKKCFPSLCVPCGLPDLIDALKKQYAHDKQFVDLLNAMTPRLIIEGKVAHGVQKDIVRNNSIDVVLHDRGEGKHRAASRSSGGNSGGGNSGGGNSGGGNSGGGNSGGGKSGGGKSGGKSGGGKSGGS